MNLKEIITDYVRHEKERGESAIQIEADLDYYVDEALNSAFPDRPEDAHGRQV